MVLMLIQTLKANRVIGCLAARLMTTSNPLVLKWLTSTTSANQSNQVYETEVGRTVYVKMDSDYKAWLNKNGTPERSIFRIWLLPAA